MAGVEMHLLSNFNTQASVRVMEGKSIFNLASSGIVFLTQLKFPPVGDGDMFVFDICDTEE